MATASPAHETATSTPHMHTFLRPLRLLHLWHLTSLDAPTVAVVWTLAFAQAARVHLPLWVPVVLALVGWSVYIGDRLMDVFGAERRGGGLLSGVCALRPRHYFHWRHRRLLLPVAIAAAVIAAGLVLHSMPVAARERNSILAAAALAYFGGVHSPWRPALMKIRLPIRLPKELLVGILFTLACVVPAWARMPEGAVESLTLLPAVLVFMLLAWLNCHAIEAWESKGCGRDSRVGYLAFGLAGAALIAATTFGLLGEPQPIGLLVAAAAAAVLTAGLDRFRHRMQATTLRASADLVLLTPVLLLLRA